MFGGSGVAVGGALAAAAFLYVGVKEILTFNPKGIFWGAVLVGGAIAIAGFTGATSTEAARIIGDILSFAFQILGQVASTVQAATGLPGAVVYLAVALFVLAAFRGGKKK